MEGKSHRTKKEMRQRKQAEDALLTNSRLKESQEVKDSPLAHKEFLRIKKLLTTINKNDDLYGAIINRYCLLSAECTEFEEKREKFMDSMAKLEGEYESFAESDDLKTYYKLQSDMQKNLIAVDRQVQAKRKMLLDIEKENVMTIAAALRTIPKTPDKKKNPLSEALNGSG